MNGRLATADLTASVSNSVYQCRQKYAVATVTLVNRAYTPCKIRIAVGTTQIPAPEDYIEYDTEIPGKGHIERTGVAVDGQSYITVESDSDNVNCVVWGSEVDLV